MTTTTRKTLTLVPTPPVEPAQKALMFGPAHRTGEEIFPEGESLPVQVYEKTHITCAVCRQPARVPVTYPALLCEACFSDLHMTRQSVAVLNEAYNRRAIAVYDDWQAVKAATEPEVLARWERAEQAGVEPSQAFAGSWTQRTQLDTPLTRLLCAWDAMQRECEAIEEGHRHIAAARRELTAAERVLADEEPERPPIGWRITVHGNRWLLHKPGGAATWHVSEQAARMAAEVEGLY